MNMRKAFIEAHIKTDSMVLSVDRDFLVSGYSRRHSKEEEIESMAIKRYKKAAKTNQDLSQDCPNTKKKKKKKKRRKKKKGKKKIPNRISNVSLIA